MGAADGFSINTTYGLELHGWTVLSVEANPENLPSLHTYRKWVENCAVGREVQESATFHVHVDNPEAYSALTIAHHPVTHAEADAPWKDITVRVETIDSLMAKWNLPALDVLCVDTEGTEDDVLAGCDFARWKPLVVIVEAWDDQAPCLKTLAGLGYTLVAQNVDNYLFVRPL